MKSLIKLQILYKCCICEIPYTIYGKIFHVFINYVKLRWLRGWMKEQMADLLACFIANWLSVGLIRTVLARLNEGHNGDQAERLSMS